jgi:HEAT repeats
VTAPIESAQPAWRVYDQQIYDASRRMRELAGERLPHGRGPSTFDGLTAAQVKERIAPVIAALERDLRVEQASPHAFSITLEALASLRGSAAPAAPTILDRLDRFSTRWDFHIPYVCASMKALAQIDPTSPAVIEAATRMIEKEGLPGHGVCHTCGCALELLTKSGPAARPIAGPVLQRAIADKGFLTTYEWQLGRALTAIGLSDASEASRAVVRARDTSIMPGNRAEVLRALAAHAESTPADRAVIRDAATQLLSDELPEIRVAAADTLGATGADAVPALIQAMRDWHYRVRVAAATSLSKIGRPALAAAPTLAAALDPYLGAAAASSAALMAIGPEAVPAVEARFESLPPTDRSRPIVGAVMLSLRDGHDRVTPMLARDLRHGPQDKGFVEIESLRTKDRGTAYEPDKHRIRVRFTVLRYGTPIKTPPETGEIAVVAWQGVNNGIAALAGRRAGDRVRLLLSPEIAQSLAWGTPKHQDAYRTYVLGTPGYFDVTIDRVCEPQIWTIVRNWRIETSCRD